MAYDPKLCDEKHASVNSSLAKVWTTIGILVLIGIAAIGYAVAHADDAHTIATELKIRQTEVDQKFDRIIKLLEALEKKP